MISNSKDFLMAKKAAVAEAACPGEKEAQLGSERTKTFKDVSHLEGMSEVEIDQMLYLEACYDTYCVRFREYNRILT